MPGLTLAGFEIATLADLRDQINAAWLLAFGSSMDVSDRSPDGQLIGIVAERFALLWELGEAINSSQDPNKAAGAALDAICALTGTRRRLASFSAVTVTLTGTPTTPVAAGSLISTVSTGRQFQTLELATIAAAAAWAGSTTYAAGAAVTNASSVYRCSIAGTSAASGGPTTDATEITDGTVRWRFLGEGAGFVEVLTRATVTGPVVAVSGDLRTIDTPAGGWLSAINELDATVGRNAMTNAELRVLREFELAQPGTGPKDAIRAALLDPANVPNVLAATVFHNTSDVIDADGMPPHSVEALVQGGEDQAIWNTLLANVVGGIKTHGTEVGAAIDSSGTSHVVKFSRSEDLLIFVAATITKDPSTYPADGDDQVKLAIATWGNAQANGRDVVASAVSARVFDVPGLIKVSSLLISAFPITTPVSSADIPVSLRQRAVFDTSRTNVSSANGVP